VPTLYQHVLLYKYLYETIMHNPQPFYKVICLKMQAVFTATQTLFL